MAKAGQFQITVNKRDLKQVHKVLDNLQGKTPNVVKNAVNRTATKVRRQIVQRTRKGYTIKGVKVGDYKIQRASSGSLTAIIRGSGRPRTLKEFKTTAPKSGAKADVARSGLKRLVGKGGKAFLSKAWGDPHIMQRVGKDRYPVKVLHSNSVPMMGKQVFTGKHGGPDMKPEVQKTLHDEIHKDLAKLVGGGS